MGMDGLLPVGSFERGRGPGGRRLLALAIPLWILALGSGQAVAVGGPAGDAYEGISAQHFLALHVLLDVYLGHNFNNPFSGQNQLRAFDVKSDIPSVNLFRLTLAHKPQQLGFRIDAGFGDTADAFMKSDPAATQYPTLARSLSFVEQAFVTFIIPVGPHGIAVDAGKFGTPIGMEDNETPANWNYSRALTYTFAEPSLHTGLRATYEPGASTAVSLFWLNGWNANIVDGNALRAYAATALFRPHESIELVLVYAGGLERAATRLSVPSLSFRNVLNFVVVYRPWKKLELALNADYGNDRAQGGVNWGGAAAYVRWQATAIVGIAVRGEYLGDPRGFITGAGQNLGEVTWTVDARVSLGATAFLTRAEYRHDRSTARVFAGGLPKEGFKEAQDTLTLGVLFWF